MLIADEEYAPFKEEHSLKALGPKNK